MNQKQDDIHFSPGETLTAPAPSLPERASGLPTIDASDMAQEAGRADEGMETPPRGLQGYEAKDAKDAERRRTILSGSVAQGVFQIALPSVATMLLQTTNGLLDRFFVSSLGVEAIAAATTSSTLMFALMSAGMAVSVGTTAFVARSVGENNIKDAETATQQSLILGVLISVAIGIPMWFLRHAILRGLGLHAESLPLADSYLQVAILGLPTLLLMVIMNGAFRGIGDTVRPFWVTLGANAVHAGFNYLLIFGKFGFPKLGLMGGAVALVLSQAVAVALYAFFLRRSSLRNMRYSVRVQRDWATRIARIGLPASGQQILRVGSMLAFQGLLTRTGAGDGAVAALGVGLASESIAFMPGFGYSIAASAFVGQNLGAKQVSRANAGAWAATWQAIGVMCVMGAIFFTFADPLAHIFIRHAAGETAAKSAEIDEALRLTVAYLKIAAFSEPFLGLGMVLTGALQGAGETVSPTMITIVTMVVIRLPLAYVLSQYTSLGTVGAWMAMSVSTVLMGVFTVVIFRQGKWRTTQV